MEEMIVAFVVFVIIIVGLCFCCFHKHADNESVRNDFNHRPGTIPLEHESTHPDLIGQRTIPTGRVQRQRAEVQEMGNLRQWLTDAANANYENISLGNIWLPFNIPMAAIPQDSPSSEPSTESICNSSYNLSQPTCDDISDRTLCVSNARQSVNDLSQNKSFKNSSLCLNPQPGTSTRYSPNLLPPILPDLSNPIRQTVDNTNGLVINTSRIVFYQNLASNDMTRAESITFMQSDVTTSLCRRCRKPQCKCSSHEELSNP